mmetsp:Transcript_31323/g.69392  ORF Transcript_31323/g.69392 Transcript_31323/m.69392 type:complete len:249 (-) Transcript_31323:333-1079(-)
MLRSLGHFELKFLIGLGWAVGNDGTHEQSRGDLHFGTAVGRPEDDASTGALAVGTEDAMAYQHTRGDERFAVTVGGGRGCGVFVCGSIGSARLWHLRHDRSRVPLPALWTLGIITFHDRSFRDRFIVVAVSTGSSGSGRGRSRGCLERGTSPGRSNLSHPCGALLTRQLHLLPLQPSGGDSTDGYSRFRCLPRGSDRVGAATASGAGGSGSGILHGGNGGDGGVYLCATIAIVLLSAELLHFGRRFTC